MSLAGRVVCVTGATGFVGTRLVERLLLDQGAAVRGRAAAEAELLHSRGRDLAEESPAFAADF